MASDVLQIHGDWPPRNYEMYMNSVFGRNNKMNESLIHEMWTYVASLCALFIFVADIRKITTKFHCVGYIYCKYQLFVQFVVHSTARFHLQFDKQMNISTILVRRFNA